MAVAVKPTEERKIEARFEALVLDFLAYLEFERGLARNTLDAYRTDQLQFGVFLAERVVERGKIITAAGVSSGIDMALTLLDRLYGPDMAQMIQLAIEYDPQPPFDAGSPAKAPTELVDLVQQMMGDGPTLPATSTSGGSR